MGQHRHPGKFFHQNLQHWEQIPHIHYLWLYWKKQNKEKCFNFQILIRFSLHGFLGCILEMNMCEMWRIWSGKYGNTFQMCTKIDPHVQFPRICLKDIKQKMCINFIFSITINKEHHKLAKKLVRLVKAWCFCTNSYLPLLTLSCAQTCTKIAYTWFMYSEFV
jgi:hypothetical protein